MRRRRLVMASLCLVTLLLGTRVAQWLAWTHTHPCWRSSNAEWCGHFCDDDPCACPQRDDLPDPFGGGPGCPDP